MAYRIGKGRLAAALVLIGERHKRIDGHVLVALTLLGWSKTATFAQRIGALADFTGWSERAVRASLSRLVEAGALIRESRAEGGTADNGWNGEGVRLVIQPPISERFELTPREALALEIQRSRGKHAIYRGGPEAPEIAPLAGDPEGAGKAPDGLVLLAEGETAAIAHAVEAIGLDEEILEAHALARLQLHGIRTLSRLPSGEALEQTRALVRMLMAECCVGQTEAARAVGLAYCELAKPFLLEHKWPLAAIGKDLADVELGARAKLRRLATPKAPRAEDLPPRSVRRLVPGAAPAEARAILEQLGRAAGGAL